MDYFLPAHLIQKQCTYLDLKKQLPERRKYEHTINQSVIKGQISLNIMYFKAHSFVYLITWDNFNYIELDPLVMLLTWEELVIVLLVH